MILCHIVGINNKSKETFLNEIKKLSINIFIIDLDTISKKISISNPFNCFLSLVMITKSGKFFLSKRTIAHSPKDLY